MVDRLAEVGMELVEALRRRVVEPEPDAAPVAAEDVGLAFSRLARSVRLTVMLAGRIEDEMSAVDDAPIGIAGPAGAEAILARAKAKIRLQVRKDEVRDVAGRAIEAEGREDGAGIDVERLLAELDERLDEREADESVWLTRPLGELAARVCRDLGVRYDPAVWEDGWEGGDRPVGSGEGFAPAPPPDPHERATIPARGREGFRGSG